MSAENLSEQNRAVVSARANLKKAENALTTAVKAAAVKKQENMNEKKTTNINAQIQKLKANKSKIANISAVISQATALKTAINNNLRDFSSFKNDNYTEEPLVQILKNRKQTPLPNESVKTKQIIQLSEFIAEREKAKINANRKIANINAQILQLEANKKRLNANRKARETEEPKVTPLLANGNENSNNNYRKLMEVSISGPVLIIDLNSTSETTAVVMNDNSPMTLFTRTASLSDMTFSNPQIYVYNLNSNKQVYFKSLGTGTDLYPIKKPENTASAKPLKYVHKYAKGDAVMYKSKNRWSYGKIKSINNKQAKIDSLNIPLDNIRPSNQNRSVKLDSILRFKNNSKTLTFNKNGIKNPFLLGSKNEGDFKKYMRSIHLQIYYKQNQIVTGVVIDPQKYKNFISALVTNIPSTYRAKNAFRDRAETEFLLQLLKEAQLESRLSKRSFLSVLKNSSTFISRAWRYTTRAMRSAYRYSRKTVGFNTSGVNEVIRKNLETIDQTRKDRLVRHFKETYNEHMGENIKANNSTTLFNKYCSKVLQKDITVNESINPRPGDIYGIKIDSDFKYAGVIYLGNMGNITGSINCNTAVDMLHKIGSKAKVSSKVLALADPKKNDICPSYHTKYTSNVSVLPVPNCCIRKPLTNIIESTEKDLKWIKTMDNEVQMVSQTISDKIQRAQFLNEWKELRTSLINNFRAMEEASSSRKETAMKNLPVEVRPLFSSLIRRIRNTIGDSLLEIFHFFGMMTKLTEFFPKKSNPPFYLYYYIPGNNNITGKYKDPRVFIEYRTDMGSNNLNNNATMQGHIIELERGRHFEVVSGTIQMKIPDHRQKNGKTNSRVDPKLNANNKNTNAFPITSYPNAFPIADLNPETKQSLTSNSMKAIGVLIAGGTVAGAGYKAYKNKQNAQEKQKKINEARKEVNAAKKTLNTNPTEATQKAYNDAVKKAANAENAQNESFNAPTGLTISAIMNSTLIKGFIGPVSLAVAELIMAFLNTGASFTYSAALGILNIGSTIVTSVGSTSVGAAVGGSLGVSSGIAGSIVLSPILVLGLYKLFKYLRSQPEVQVKQQNNNIVNITSVFVNINGKLQMKYLQKGTLNSMYTKSIDFTKMFLTMGSSTMKGLSSFTATTLSGLSSFSSLVAKNPITYYIAISMSEYLVKKICGKLKLMLNVGNNVKFNPNTANSWFNTKLKGIASKGGLKELIAQSVNPDAIRNGFSAMQNSNVSVNGVKKVGKGAFSGAVMAISAASFAGSLSSIMQGIFQKQYSRVFESVLKALNTWLNTIPSASGPRALVSLAKTCYDVPKPVYIGVTIHVQDGSNIIKLKSRADFSNGELYIDHKSANSKQSNEKVKKLIENKKSNLNKILQHKLFFKSNKNQSLDIHLKISPEDRRLVLPITMKIPKMNSAFEYDVPLNGHFFKSISYTNPNFLKLQVFNALKNKRVERNQNANIRLQYHTTKQLQNSLITLDSKTINIENTTLENFSVVTNKNSKKITLPVVFDMVNLSLLILSAKNAKDLNSVKSSQFKSMIYPVYKNTTIDNLLHDIRIPNPTNQVYSHLSPKHLSKATQNVIKARLSLAKSKNVNITPKLSLYLTYDDVSTTKNTNQLKSQSMYGAGASVVGAVATTVLGGLGIAAGAALFVAFGGVAAGIVLFNYINSPRYMYSITTNSTAKNSESTFKSLEEKLNYGSNDCFTIEYTDRTGNSQKLIRHYINTSYLYNMDSPEKAFNSKSVYFYTSETIQMNTNNTAKSKIPKSIYYLIMNSFKTNLNHLSYTFNDEKFKIDNLPIELIKCELYIKPSGLSSYFSRTKSPDVNEAGKPTNMSAYSDYMLGSLKYVTEFKLAICSYISNKDDFYKYFTFLIRDNIKSINLNGNNNILQNFKTQVESIRVSLYKSFLPQLKETNQELLSNVKELTPIFITPDTQSTFFIDLTKTNNSYGIYINMNKL